MKTKDQIEFYNLLVEVSVLLANWREGDDSKIQQSINALSQALYERDERLKKEAA